ncbi:MAG: hypothetical protein QM642_09360 [Edaphocola sp.]
MHNFITKPQIGLLHTLLHKYARLRGYAMDAAEKADMALIQTNGRTDTTTGLTQAEARTWIAELQTITRTPEDGSAERQRRHIIAMAHEMGWQQPGGKIDMAHLNSWVASRGYLNRTHRTLNQYTQKELPRLVTQFKKVHGDFKKKVMGG